MTGEHPDNFFAFDVPQPDIVIAVVHRNQTTIRGNGSFLQRIFGLQKRLQDNPGLNDAQFSSGGNGPMNESRPILVPIVSKYRGPGTITLGTENQVKFTTVSGGKPLQAYSGRATTTVSFSEPGDYVLHININDYSGNGGGGSGCCWTTVMMKVAVKGTPAQ